jgi:RNA polymerase sigma factor (sigma-70 family)
MTSMVPRPASPRSVADAEEFERFLRPHVPAFFRAAYRWTNAVDRAEDLVQELLVRLYPRVDELRHLQKIRPWAMRVMYRIFVDELRHERSSPVQFGLQDEDTENGPDENCVDPSADPPGSVERQLTQERILTAWTHLSADHRALLAMHDIEEYSLPEVAEIIDVPIGTLKSRLHRARARLRELLSTERSDEPDRVSVTGNST